MSVLKNFRDTSEMQFYKTAISIRNEITHWLLRDFNTRRSARGVEQVVKDIDPDDQKIVDEIFAKYGKSPKRTFQTQYPQWFVDHERTVLMQYLSDLMKEIMIPNSIYAKTMADWSERRKHQNTAIGICFLLYQEIHYIISLFPNDLNTFVHLLDDLEKEIVLLRGWRKSDSQRSKGAS